MNALKATCLAVSVAVVCTAGVAAEMEIGAKMVKADRQMKNIDGKMIALNGVKGEHGTVVAFWCNHCPVVKKYKGLMVKLANEYSGKGIGFVAVNANDPAKVAADSFDAMVKDAEKHGYKFAYTVDAGSELAKAMGASRTPHIFLFNAKAELAYVGAIEGGEGKNWLKDAMDALIGGKDVPVAKSKAFGCSIKWYAK
jgi:thiol-disulfide isomerase/thioredoxin